MKGLAEDDRERGEETEDKGEEEGKETKEV